MLIPITGSLAQSLRSGINRSTRSLVTAITTLQAQHHTQSDDLRDDDSVEQLGDATPDSPWISDVIRSPLKLASLPVLPGIEAEISLSEELDKIKFWDGVFCVSVYPD